MFLIDVCSTLVSFCVAEERCAGVYLGSYIRKNVSQTKYLEESQDVPRHGTENRRACTARIVGDYAARYASTASELLIFDVLELRIICPMSNVLHGTLDL